MMKTYFKLTHILLFKFCDKILCLIFPSYFILQLYNAWMLKIICFMIYRVIVITDGSNFYLFFTAIFLATRRVTSL